MKSPATQTAKATNEISGQIAAMQAATGLTATALRSIRRPDRSPKRVRLAAAGTADVNSNIAAVAHVVEETGSRAEGVLQAATEVAGRAATLKNEVANFLVAVQQAA